MKPLTIETFNPDMIKAINLEQKKSGNMNYTSVKFTYDGGKIPPLRVDGKFKLFKFKNPKADIYSLSIKCNEENERFCGKKLILSYTEPRFDYVNPFIIDFACKPKLESDFYYFNTFDIARLE